LATVGTGVVLEEVAGEVRFGTEVEVGPLGLLGRELVAAAEQPDTPAASAAANRIVAIRRRGAMTDDACHAGQGWIASLTWLIASSATAR
jgi:hypothetical protein